MSKILDAPTRNFKAVNETYKKVMTEDLEPVVANAAEGGVVFLLRKDYGEDKHKNSRYHYYLQFEQRAKGLRNYMKWVTSVEAYDWYKWLRRGKEHMKFEDAFVDDYTQKRNKEGR